MISCGLGGVWPYIELSKYYEHIAKDNARALRYANSALIYALNTLSLKDEDENHLDAIRRRIERLKKKQKRSRRILEE